MNILFCDTSTMMATVGVAYLKEVSQGVLSSAVTDKNKLSKNVGSTASIKEAISKVVASTVGATVGEAQLLSFKQLERGQSHSDILNDMVKGCLKEASLSLNDIDVFVSGVGPGSFTGIRISLNTIKTWGYIFNKPCLGINTLDVLVRQIQQEQDSVVVMMNAFKNMVYFAEYEIKKNSLGELEYIVRQNPQAVRVQQLNQYVKGESLVVGDGFDVYKNYIQDKLKLSLIRPENANNFPDPKNILEVIKLHQYEIYRWPMLSVIEQKQLTKDKTIELYHHQSLVHWSDLKPLYIRESEAEENKRGFKYQPL